MQETNNFTNLTRLSSFLLLDMLLLTGMPWNTHLSAKNTARKRNILGDHELEIDKRRVGKRCRSWTLLDLTGFRLRDRRKSSQKLAKQIYIITLVSFSTPSPPSPLKRTEIAKQASTEERECWLWFSIDGKKKRFQEEHLFSRTGQAFFLLRFFPFFLFLFAFFFFWNATAYFAQFAIRGLRACKESFLKKGATFMNHITLLNWKSTLDKLHSKFACSTGHFLS